MIDVKNITGGPKVINARPPVVLLPGEEREDLIISRAEFEIAAASGWFELDGQPEAEEEVPALVDEAVIAAQTGIDDLKKEHATVLQAANDRADKAEADLAKANKENAVLREQLETANRSEPGPLDQSVQKLIAYLEGVTDADEVQKLIDGETAGKSRAGAISALEARRDALLA